MIIGPGIGYMRMVVFCFRPRKKGREEEGEEGEKGIRGGASYGAERAESGISGSG